MTTKIKDQVLKVFWQYSTDKKKTTCFMVASSPEGSDAKPIGSVTIGLYYKDRFEYEKARKTSLKRLLETTGLDRSARAEIWRAYFNRKPVKK